MITKNDRRAEREKQNAQDYAYLEAIVIFMFK